MTSQALPAANAARSIVTHSADHQQGNLSVCGEGISSPSKSTQKQLDALEKEHDRALAELRTKLEQSKLSCSEKQAKVDSQAAEISLLNKRIVELSARISEDHHESHNPQRLDDLMKSKAALESRVEAFASSEQSFKLEVLKLLAAIRQYEHQHYPDKPSAVTMPSSPLEVIRITHASETFTISISFITPVFPRGFLHLILPFRYGCCSRYPYWYTYDRLPQQT